MQEFGWGQGRRPRRPPRRKARRRRVLSQAPEGVSAKQLRDARRGRRQAMLRQQQQQRQVAVTARRQRRLAKLQPVSSQPQVPSGYTPPPGYALVPLAQAQQGASPGGGQTSVPPALSGRHPGWGPMTKVGSHLQLRVDRAHRAAVAEIKPGMYVVELVPRQPRMGAVAALLAPLAVKAAQKAIENPEGFRRGLSRVTSKLQPGGDGGCTCLPRPRPWGRVTDSDSEPELEGVQLEGRRYPKRC